MTRAIAMIAVSKPFQLTHSTNPTHALLSMLSVEATTRAHGGDHRSPVVAEIRESLVWEVLRHMGVLGIAITGP